MVREYPKFKFLPRIEADYCYVPPGTPPEAPNPWLDPRFFHLTPTAKEIAKSGIFTPDGKLKGSIPKEIGFRNPGRKDEIDDLPGLVLKLAQALDIFSKLGKKEEWQKILNSRIGLILNEFDELIEILEKCQIGEATLKRWNKLKNQMVIEKEKALPKIEAPIISDVIDLCIKAFKQHIVDTPGIGDIIAHRTSELLNYFNINEEPVKPETVSKRMQRKFK